LHLVASDLCSQFLLRTHSAAEAHRTASRPRCGITTRKSMQEIPSILLQQQLINVGSLKASLTLKCILCTSLRFYMGAQARRIPARGLTSKQHNQFQRCHNNQQLPAPHADCLQHTCARPRQRAHEGTHAPLSQATISARPPLSLYIIIISISSQHFPEWVSLWLSGQSRYVQYFLHRGV
jgi:hypothetical protein